MKHRTNSFLEKGKPPISLFPLRGLLVLSLFVLFVLPQGFAQGYLEIIRNSKTRNFAQIVKEVEAYYANKDKGRGSGYNQFKRWEEFNRSRLDEQGNIQNIAKRYLTEIYNYKLSRGRVPDEIGAVGSWSSMGPSSHILTTGWNGGIGRVNCVAVDPGNSNIIYVGTPAGGLWRSTNNGATWSPLTDGITSLGVSGIVIDPASPAANRIIYILTGDGDGGNTNSIGVLKSTDNGATWNSTGLSWTVLNFINGYKLAMYPGNSNTLFAVTTSGIYRTVNAGLNWSLVLSGSFRDLEFKPGTPQTIYVSGSGTFYRSTDGGTTWTLITSGLPAAGSRYAIAVSANNPNYVYLLNGSVPAAGQFGGVYRSANSGTSFTLRSNTPNILGYADDGSDGSSQGWYDLAIAVSPSNAEEVHTGGINCWKSINGGTTWASTSKWVEGTAGAGNYTHADIHSLDFYGSILYCGSDGGISRSSNNANDWTDISTGLVITQMYRISVDATNPDKFVCGTQDNGTNRFEGGNFYHWIGADGMQCIIDPANTNIQYGCIQGGSSMYKTTNNGTSIFGITPAGAGGGNWITPYVMDPANSNTLYAGYTNLWKTTNGGTSWANISGGNIGGGACDHIAVAPSNTQVIYVSKGGTLYKTTNGGTTWATAQGTGANTLPGIFISWFDIHPTDPNTVWLSLGGFSAGQKVYRTTDGGANWTNISGTLPNLPANTVVYRSSGTPGLYVGMDVGVYSRPNSAADWTAFNTGLPNVIVKELEIRGNHLYAGTFGRGMWRTDFASCPASLVFSGTQSGTQVFEAQNTITSTASVTSGSIQYKAGTRVTLSPGFRANSSTAYFRARIAPCGTPVVEPQSNDITGIYAGPMEGLIEQQVVLNNGADKALVSANIRVFPNPFTSTTTIEYSLPADGMLSIEVVDVVGRRVAEIVDGENYRAGIYTFNFDGSELQSGIYTCILKHNGDVQSSLLFINR